MPQVERTGRNAGQEFVDANPTCTSHLRMKWPYEHNTAKLLKQSGKDFKTEGASPVNALNIALAILIQSQVVVAGPAHPQQQPSEPCPTQLLRWCELGSPPTAAVMCLSVTLAGYFNSGPVPTLEATSDELLSMYVCQMLARWEACVFAVFCFLFLVHAGVHFSGTAYSWTASVRVGACAVASACDKEGKRIWKTSPTNTKGKSYDCSTRSFGLISGHQRT